MVFKGDDDFMSQNITNVKFEIYILLIDQNLTDTFIYD